MKKRPPSPRGSRGGILKKVTAADCGLVETPALAPHLAFRPLDDAQVLLVSETFNTLLHGRIHSDLLPLLDGRPSLRDIVAHLAPRTFGIRRTDDDRVPRIQGICRFRRLRDGSGTGGVLVLPRRLAPLGRGTPGGFEGRNHRRRRSPRPAARLDGPRLDGREPGRGHGRGRPVALRRRLHRLSRRAARGNQSTPCRVGHAMDAGPGEWRAASVRSRLSASAAGAVLGLPCLSLARPPGGAQLPAQSGRRQCRLRALRGRACRRGRGVRTHRGRNRQVAGLREPGAHP